MTSRATIWVPGTAAEPEDQAVVHTRFYGGVVEMVRYGWGTQFETPSGATSNIWYHIPITIPVILDNDRLQLKKIFVLYKNGAAATITSIHVYDGPKKIQEFNNCKLGGDHSEGIDESNTFAIEQLVDIKYGLDISVHVEHWGDPDSRSRRYILFTGAGADFE